MAAAAAAGRPLAPLPLAAAPARVPAAVAQASERPPSAQAAAGPAGPRQLRAPLAALAAGAALAERASRRRRGAVRRRIAEGSGGGSAAAPPVEEDFAGRLRLQYQPEGWQAWEWKPEGELRKDGPFKCHYVASGPLDGTPVVLVHGFGASSYHWRYQVPALAASGCRVYALCLLGYGWSPRVPLRYTGEVWAEQVNAFIRNVVGRPAVLAGNSVGAFASLLSAALEPELCNGLVLLNAAGRFEERQPGMEPARTSTGDAVAEAAESAEPGPIQWVLQQITRAVAGWAFYSTKVRIQPILQWVYVNGQQVDDELVTSIRTPADHPEALDTFGQVIQAGRRTELSVFDALDKLPTSLPLLVLWGMQDPWMRPERAAAILSECAERGIACKYVEIDAGHCPQDDAPEVVNASMIDWLKEIAPGARETLQAEAAAA